LTKDIKFKYLPPFDFTAHFNIRFQFTSMRPLWLVFSIKNYIFLLFNYQNIKYKKLQESNSRLQGSEQGQVMHWHLREGNEKEYNGRECLHHFPYNGWWSSREAAIPGEQRYIVLHVITLDPITSPFAEASTWFICTFSSMGLDFAFGLHWIENLLLFLA